MRLVLTVNSLRELIRDQRAAGVDPAAILLSPHDKRDVKQELLELSAKMSGALKDREGDLVGDEDVLGVIQGCFILSHRNVPRGKAWVLPKKKPKEAIALG